LPFYHTSRLFSSKSSGTLQLIFCTTTMNDNIFLTRSQNAWDGEDSEMSLTCMHCLFDTKLIGAQDTERHAYSSRGSLNKRIAFLRPTTSFSLSLKSIVFHQACASSTVSYGVSENISTGYSFGMGTHQWHIDSAPSLVLRCRTSSLSYYSRQRL
jgi:hypothetical protein